MVANRPPINELKDDISDMTNGTVVISSATTEAMVEGEYQKSGPKALDGSDTILWNPLLWSADGPPKRKPSRLKIPTLNQLLASSFKDRQHLLFPWLREQESCMIYAASYIRVNRSNRMLKLAFGTSRTAH